MEPALLAKATSTSPIVRRRRNNPYAPVRFGVTPSTSASATDTVSDRSGSEKDHVGECATLCHCDSASAGGRTTPSSCECEACVPSAGTLSSVDHPSPYCAPGSPPSPYSRGSEVHASALSIEFSPATSATYATPQYTEYHHSPLPVAPLSVKIAVVSFKFGSNAFRAPFRVSPGDTVVVEWDETRTLHIGVVSAVLNAPPLGAPVPILSVLRRARPDDLRKLELIRLCDAATVAESQRVIDNLERGGRLTRRVAVVDAEWQFDKASATVLIHFAGSKDDMEAIHAAVTDRLRTQVYILTTEQRQRTF